MSTNQRSGKRIVLTTYGSLGDLHPFLALAIGLKKRGHHPVLATHAVYQSKIESEGVAFHAVRPDLLDLGDEKEFIRKAFDIRRGPEYLVRNAVVAPIRKTYADLDDAIGDNTDLLITHPLTFTGPLIAEKRGIPWLSTALAPTSFFSAYDPSVLAPAPFISDWQSWLGPALFGKLMKTIQRVPYSWTEPVRALRKEIGLPYSSADPLFEGQFSPYGTLALFSSALGKPQPDWPKNTVQTGFAFYDRLDAGTGLSSEIESFLKAGEAPIVFTLGSSAVMSAGEFYAVSTKAAARLKRRAILLIGRDERNIPFTPLPEGIAAFPYAPYSELFPRAAVIVHQGGVGTTGQALRAGRPQLVVPYGFDQPDNAARITRAGAGRTISRSRYTERCAMEALQAFLHTSSYASKAALIGQQIQKEDGVTTACDFIEAQL